MSIVQTFGKGIGRDFKTTDDLMTWVVFGDEKSFGKYITRDDNTF